MRYAKIRKKENRKPYENELQEMSVRVCMYICLHKQVAQSDEKLYLETRLLITDERGNIAVALLWATNCGTVDFIYARRYRIAHCDVNVTISQRSIVVYAHLSSGMD